MMFILHNTYESTWHVGQKLNYINPLDVRMVQADGDELEEIKNKIENIPFTVGRVQRWFGDDAKFIVANL